VWWWLVVPRWNFLLLLTTLRILLFRHLVPKVVPSPGVVVVSDELEFSDVTTGDRVKCGAHVDGGVYTAFRQWVEDETGKQYMEVGRAIDRAMLEYMTDDKLAEINEQTKKNEALLRQVLGRLDREKVKEKTSQDVPKGKDPGSRREREGFVIQALLGNGYQRVTRDILDQAVREVAEVSTDRTVKDYSESVTSTAAFQSHPNGNTWRFDTEGAKEVLRDRNIPIPSGV